MSDISMGSDPFAVALLEKDAEIERQEALIKDLNERFWQERAEVERLKVENEELRVLARQLSDAACFGAHHPKDE